MLAAIRPDAVNLPLFLHVLGAMLLVGSLAFVAVAILIGWGGSDRAVSLTRLALRAVPYGVLPAWLLMRLAGQWTASEAGFDGDDDPTWLGIGYTTAEAGGLLILASVVLAVIGLRKLRAGGGLALGRAVGLLSIVLVAAYVVAVWAMTAKPS